MNGEKLTSYGYRWVVLAAFMLVTAANQAAWITFAPITREASAWYQTSDLVIGMLSLCFMAVYVLTVLPAAWVIDTLGFRPAVSIGALLTGVGALGRGLLSSSLAGVFAFQIVIALGQPLVLGAITKMAARWFLPRQRGIATGLGTLSMYLGILAGVLVTPMLLAALEIRGMLLAWGVIAAVAAALFLAFARERPPTPASVPGTEERALVLDGLRSLFGKRDFVILMVVFFVGLGMFNSVTTWIEEILKPRGFTASQAGVAGGLMLAGGILGAAIVPAISDLIRRRKPFIIVALAAVVPCLVGIALARGYALLLVSSTGLGFFLLSCGPIGFQYGAEVTLPAPEGTSNSLLLVMGQVSGIVFIFGMDALEAPGGSMTLSLLVLAGLVAACFVLSLFLADSPIGQGDAPVRAAQPGREPGGNRS